MYFDDPEAHCAQNRSKGGIFHSDTMWFHVGDTRYWEGDIQYPGETHIEYDDWCG